MTARGAKIILLRDVLKALPSDALVQQHANMVLSLCMDCGQNRMGIECVLVRIACSWGPWRLTAAPSSLTWPVIIAGSQLYGADRSRVLSILELFRYETRFRLYSYLLNLVPDAAFCRAEHPKHKIPM